MKTFPGSMNILKDFILFFPTTLQEIVHFTDGYKEIRDFTNGSMVKTPPALQETRVQCPGGGHGNPLQDSCSDSPVDREGW